MTTINSSLGKADDGTPLVQRAALSLLSGARKLLTRAEFDTAIAAERTRITNNGSGIYKDGEEFQILGEAGYRILALGGSAAATHARTVVLFTTILVLPADTSVAYLTTGAPSAGTGANGDVAADLGGNVYYSKASGAWAASGSLVKLDPNLVMMGDGRTLQAAFNYVLNALLTLGVGSAVPTVPALTFGNLPYRIGFYPWDPSTNNSNQNSQFLQDTDEWNRIMGVKPGSKNVFTDWTQDIGNWAGDIYYKLLAMSLTGDNYVGPGSGIIPEIGIGMINHVMGLDQFMTEIIAGSHNDIFYNLALNAAQSGFPVCHFRPGYEFNGGFMPWSPANSGDANRFSNFIGAFRVIYTQIQAAYTHARANGFPNAIAKVVWNPTSINYNSGNIIIENLYPGDAYVDVIGIDIYGKMYPRDLTDWRDGHTQMANFAAWSAVKENVWHYLSYNDANQFNPTGDGGGCSFERLVDFAIAHNKPFSMPECGCGNDSTSVGAIDNFQFVDWFRDACDRAIARGATILNMNVWCTDQGDGGWGFLFDQRPQAAARWNADFGMPVSSAGDWELGFRGMTNQSNYAYLPNAAANTTLRATTQTVRIEHRGKFTALSGSRILVSKWNDGSDNSMKEYFFARDEDVLHAVWLSAAGIAVATSSVRDLIPAGTDVTHAVEFNPVTGSTTFYTSLDGTNFTQLGATVTATNPGAILAAGNPQDILLGQHSGGGREYKGTCSKVKVVIGGVTVVNASCGPTGMVDAITGGTFGRGAVTILRNLTANYVAPTIVPTAYATDDFEGITAQPAVSGKWTRLFDANPMQIKGGAMSLAFPYDNTGAFGMRTTTEQYTGNQFSEFTWLGIGNGDGGPMIGGSALEAVGYWVTCKAGNWQLQSLNNGYHSLVTSTSFGLPQVGDRVGIRKVFVSGNSGPMDIIVSLNDADLFHYVDNSPVVGGQPSLYIYDMGVSFASWRGGSTDKPWTSGSASPIRGSFNT